MSYEKQPTTTQDTKEITSWTIRAGGREWTLEATKYIERDGSRIHYQAGSLTTTKAIGFKAQPEPPHKEPARTNPAGLF